MTIRRPDECGAKSPHAPLSVRNLTGAEQRPLFRMPRPTPQEIRELVKARLYGFEIRQAARDLKRLAQNARNRAEAQKYRQLARKKRRSAHA